MADGIDIEAAIARCWEATFPGTPLDPDVAWRDSGADSLRSLHFMLRLEGELGRAVPLDLLGPDTSARGLARLLAGTAADEAAGKPLVFLLPGMLGDEPRLADLRRSVADRLSFCTLSLPDIDQPAAVLADVAATARLVLPAIAERQPEGPLLLAGYSFGGVLAVELARQLVAAGRMVGAVVLFDPFLRFRRFTPIQPEHDARPAIVAKRNPFADARGAGDLVDRLLFGAALATGALGPARNRLHRDRLKLSPEALWWRRQRLIGRLRWHAVRRWRPEPLDVPALLVTSDEAERHFDPAEWLAILPRAEVLHVGGKHLGLFRPEPLARIAPAFTAAVLAATQG